MSSLYFAPTYFAPTYFPPLKSGTTVGGIYFAPTYFAPTYFPSLNAGTKGGVTYFAPTYFAPTYFPPLVASSSPSPPPTPSPIPVRTRPYQDRDGFDAILGLLDSTGMFASISFGTPVERLPLGPAAAPLAALLPEGWEEFDEVDPSAILRRVRFRLELLVRGDDPLTRFERIDQLETSARDAIDGSDLGGGSLPGLTRLRRGVYDARTAYPEQVARLEGEFTYIIGTIAS